MVRFGAIMATLYRGETNHPLGKLHPVEYSITIERRYNTKINV